MAPFRPPIENWAEDIAGPAPEDVEQRLVGPDECRVISEKSIDNANGVPYRHIVMAISGTVFGYAPVNSLVLPPLGTGEEGEGQDNRRGRLERRALTLPALRAGCPLRRRMRGPSGGRSGRRNPASGRGV